MNSEQFWSMRIWRLQIAVQPSMTPQLSPQAPSSSQSCISQCQPQCVTVCIGRNFAPSECERTCQKTCSEVSWEVAKINHNFEHLQSILSNSFRNLILCWFIICTFYLLIISEVILLFAKKMEDISELYLKSLGLISFFFGKKIGQKKWKIQSFF